ncbi:MAG: glycine zipper 2TM domain-containing protein [Sphingobium sp.]|uniref:glycine zipper 2TM domain-containing protein n=1 Tax=Sphingobium sp. TaxID=1912891 RepID=UPI0029A9590A|nr:glycine zipper 2TM domain-containing protein [Sphingobium sp.]MDX3909133.1 glycine zipper 2TM domain-containing protein [Sphingobium sp.]
MKKSAFLNMGAALAMGVASFVATSAPAMARDNYRGYERGYDRGDYYRGGDRRQYRGDRYYRNNGYRNDGYRSQNYYRGGDRYSYRCRDNGTGGTIIGAIAGGLLGNEVAGRGDRTTGTILGAGVGALAGRAIDKNNGRRC